MTSLRAAHAGDASAVGAILSEFTDTTEWIPRLHSRAEDLAHADRMIARGWVTVAEHAGRVAGFAACDGHELCALYVARQARGQGIGAALLAALKQQQPALRLWTFQQNTRAQAFYRAHGFVEIGRGDGRDTDEGLPDIHFVWQKDAA